MDEEAFQALTDRLREVNEVIGELDPAIRAEAFMLLKPYVTGKAAPAKEDETDEDGEPPPASDAETFVRSQTIETPAQTVGAIAAWWFSQYGSHPIRAGDIRRIADEIGVTVSSRPDNTLRGMRTDGRPVYRAAGRGALAPTVPHGETFFRNEYRVTKGRMTPPSSDES